MNARELQKAMMQDLEDLFRKDQFKTPDHRMASPKAYEQWLPPRDAQTIDDPFPYIIVRLDSGGIEKATDPHRVAVILMIGIFDDGVRDNREPAGEPDENGMDTRNHGNTALLEIIERIQRHYEETPLLANQFVYKVPFKWVLQDEDSYPYYFGAANLTFELPPPTPKASDLV